MVIFDLDGVLVDSRVAISATTIGRALDAVERPDRAVMVGDRSFDILGARAHRIPALGVTWGIGTRTELQAADAIVDAPAELAQ